VSLALPLAAQSTNGTINGRVLDPSNKVIGGADILVISDATGVQYSGKTNEDGIYAVPNLPPGAYRLQVSKRGFKTLIKPDIVLNIQDALSINFTLPVGAAFEIVTVEGGASMINTTDASVSTVVDQTYVKNMPLNGRSFQDLILLTPGVVTQTPQVSQSAAIATGNGATGEFSVNGQRTESNYYTVDGVSANVGTSTPSGLIYGAGGSGSVAAATALGTTQALVSVDDLQEFRVQTSTYSAEYGRNPGGQFAFETKSGVNQFHGTAFDYLRNGAFDAQDWFNNYFGTPEPVLRQNDFGGTLGGPVKIPGVYNGKDRTFFFLTYEGLRLTAPQAATTNYVPDVALRSSAPTALQEALNAFPLPSPNGIDDTTNGIAQYIGSWSSPSSLNSTSVRVDHAIRDKLRLFFRFSDTVSSSTTRGNSTNGIGSPSEVRTSAYTMHTYTAGVGSNFSSRLGNEFRLNYSSNSLIASDDIDDFGGSVSVNLRQLLGLNNTSYASVSLIYGGYAVFLAEQQQSTVQRQWNLVDSLTLSVGRHQFKFGMDYRRLAPDAIQSTPVVSFDYLDNSSVQRNIALGVIDSLAAAYPLYANLSAFAQDQWRVSEHLSLALGLRWELNPAPGVTRGLKPYTIQGSSPATWTLAPQGTPLWKTTWYNFAPRLGAAYILRDTPGRETVVRGGGGVFFDTGQQLGSLGFAGPGFVAQTCCPSTPFPRLPATLPVIVNPPLAFNPLIYGFASHLQLPYTLHWNVSIEQAVGRFQTLTASYLGSHGARLLQENIYLPSNNPNTSEFTVAQNGLTSDYDSMQIAFQRKLTRGITALVSYT
jgi:hypothetical protein